MKLDASDESHVCAQGEEGETSLLGHFASEQWEQQQPCAARLGGSYNYPSADVSWRFHRRQNAFLKATGKHASMQQATKHLTAACERLSSARNCSLIDIREECKYAWSETTCRYHSCLCPTLVLPV